MACLIPVQHSDEPHQAIWFNAAAIQTVDIQSTSTGWAIYFIGPTYYAKGGAMLADEIYTTKGEVNARLAYIAKLVNSKCGTNLKITLKNK